MVTKLTDGRVECLIPTVLVLYCKRTTKPHTTICLQVLCGWLSSSPAVGQALCLLDGFPDKLCRVFIFMHSYPPEYLVINFYCFLNYLTFTCYEAFPFHLLPQTLSHLHEQLQKYHSKPHKPSPPLSNYNHLDKPPVLA